MDLEVLENLGLTARESELYTILVKLGESPVADLIRATGAHPQVVYRSLVNLTEKGLVVNTIQNHRKYVRAEDPRQLLALQEKQARKLEYLVPELLSLQVPSKEALVRVSRGNEAVRDLRRKAYASLEPGEIYYIISPSGTRFYEVVGEQNIEIERARVKRGVHKQMVGFESQRQHILDRETVPDLTEYRYLQEEFPVPSSTNIFVDTVALIIWSDPPVVITIVSGEIAESYRYYFQSLWKIAKP